LFLVLMAAMLNFLAASPANGAGLYFLPTLYSAYPLGRRHATVTAVASAVLVVLLVGRNPAMIARRVDLPRGRPAANRNRLLLQCRFSFLPKNMKL
jgi:hypothetical protein